MDGSSDLHRTDTSRRRTKPPPAEHLPSISRRTAQTLLRCAAPADVIALYFFYLNTANWQSTNRPYATTSFCAQGLQISVDRVRRARRQLIACDLIEDYIPRDAAGRLRGHYIHLKWIRRGPDQPLGFPTPGANPPMENPIPNASTSEKRSASTSQNQNASISSKQSSQLPPTPFQGESGVEFLTSEEAKYGLLTCLKQSPDRPLTPREAIAFERLSIRITPADLAALVRFYKRQLDKDDEPTDQQLLKARKQKLSTLVRNLPEQLELARNWGRRYPPRKSPPPPPDDWKEILEQRYDHPPKFESFHHLPGYVQREIRALASLRQRSKGS
jgi:hypothetical protein